MNQEELLYRIAITKIPNVGSVNTRNLVAYTGGVAAVFNEKEKNLRKIPGIGIKLAKEISESDPLELALKDLEYINKHKIKVLFYLDSAYPERLKRIDDAPAILYYKGDCNWNAQRTVGIVGTRTPSTYGQLKCEEIIQDLQAYNCQLISGLAYGIDAFAHKKACELSNENLAIMATGIDKIYPARHRKLAEEILNKGALVTEYPIGTTPGRENFPWRNRIIAGLADVTIVIESGARGGSLITAEYANAYFKDVFALPGKTTDKMSIGCNKLIKQNKAHLLESVKDLAYIMRWEAAQSAQNIQVELFSNLTIEEEALVGLLREKLEASMDQLHHELKMNLSSLSSLLLNLEFKGIILSLPGKRYCLIR